MHTFTDGIADRTAFIPCIKFMKTSQTAETLQPSQRSYDDSSAVTRLYISPLSAETLSVILPLEQQGSLFEPPFFGAPQSFPERPFAYLELPRDVADKLRKKLNGSIFKGAKLRIEEAKSERGASMSTRKRKAEVIAENKDEANTGRKTRYGRKPENGVLKGEQLPAGRRVKRGWEEGWVGVDLPKVKRNASKTKADSKDASGEPGETKMVFRTSVPPNKSEDVEDEATPRNKSHKKGKRGTSGRVEIEVKEFDNTEKVPTFLRDTSKASKNTKTTFDDEKGWVDGDGNVVEEVKSRKKDSGKKTEKRKKSKDVTTGNAEESEPPPSNGDITGNSKDSRESESIELQSQTDATPQIAVDTTALLDENVNDKGGDDADVATEPVSAEPSQLETLFKRPAPSDKSKQTNRPAPIQTFSFFGDGDEAEKQETPDPDVPIENDAASSAKSSLRRKRLTSLQIPPQTPFTRRDLDARSMRSAAPTPDTAAIGRRMKVPWMRRSQTRSASRDRDSRSMSGPAVDRGRLLRETVEGQAEAMLSVDEEGESAKELDIDAEKIKMEPSPEGEKEQTEFEKQFYEQRGELNRAWKAQRREARKSARQAQNRRGRSG